MGDQTKIKLKVSAAQAILKKPREKEAYLQQTWEHFLTNTLKLTVNVYEFSQLHKCITIYICIFKTKWFNCSGDKPMDLLYAP